MLVMPNGGYSIELNRSRSGISQRDEFAKSAGGRGKPGVALPGKAHIHGVNFVIERLEIDAVSFERPGTIDHVRQNGDAHAGRYHAANSLHGQGAEDDVGDMWCLLPVTHGGAFGLIDGEHQKWLASEIGQTDAVLVQQRMIGAGPKAARRTQQEVRANGSAVMQVGDEHDRGIDAAAHKAPFKSVTFELMEPHRDARKGSPEARQKRWQEVARNGVTDGDVDGTINLRSPAMRPPRRIRNAGLDGAGALQELLSLERKCDA